jgi:hypothetical protein
MKLLILRNLHNHFTVVSEPAVLMKVLGFER